MTPSPGALPVEGTIEKLTQWVRSPFDTTTQWSLHIKYNNLDVANFLRGEDADSCFGRLRKKGKGNKKKKQA